MVEVYPKVVEVEKKKEKDGKEKLIYFSIFYCILHFLFIVSLLFSDYLGNVTQQTFTCSKATIEILDKSVKYVEN